MDMSQLHTRRGLQCVDGLLVLLGTCAALAPLWYYTYPPSTDLPHHVAVSSVLYRLLQGEASVAKFYAFNWQPVPYHLLYVLLTPLVGWFGPLVGAKIMLSAILLGCVLATWLCCGALQRPQVMGLGGIFLFYGAIFFWGFATTLVGIPCVLGCVWALLRFDSTRRGGFVWAAGLCGALACCAHAVLILACGVGVASFWAMRPRRNFVAACAAGGLCLLPAVPWAIAQIGAPHHAAVLTFETPGTAWNHLRLHLAAFDRGLGRNCHQALCFLALSCAWLTRAATPGPQRRFCGVFFIGHALAFLLTPVEVTSPTTWAWLINVRYLVFLEAGLWFMCGEPAARAGRWALRLSVPLLTAGFLLGLLQVWHDFDAAARPLDAVRRFLPAGSTVVVRSPPERFLGAWPPLTAHLYAYALADGLAYEGGVFADGHIPIKTLRQPQGMVMPPGGVLLPVQDHEAQHPIVLGMCDYALVQATESLQAQIPAPTGGRLLWQSGLWKIFSRVKAPEDHPAPRT